MTPIRIRPAAQNDIDEAAEYIAQDDLAAGLAFLAATEKAFALIMDMPRIGRERRELAHERLAGLRSQPIPGFENWLVFYLPIQDRIDVVRILHGARDLKSALANSG